jgi:hypothetical protein
MSEIDTGKRLYRSKVLFDIPKPKERLSRADFVHGSDASGYSTEIPAALHLSA